MSEAVPAPEIFHVNAAVGWLELGNPAEAQTELNQVSEEYAGHPEVLEVQWQIFARKNDWHPALPIAQTICNVAPERPQGWLHLAVSLYRLNKTEDAWNLLLPMAARFPKSWVIPYDLACYACQLGRVEEGRVWLRRAFKLGHPPEVQALALQDPDLTVLWPEIAEARLGA